jgi:hypothetical protein
MVKELRVTIEYKNGTFKQYNLKSRSSCGKICDDALSQDRAGIIKSIEVYPMNLCL